MANRTPGWLRSQIYLTNDSLADLTVDVELFLKYLDCSGVKGTLELTTDCLAELIADGKGILSTSSTGSFLLNIKI